MSDIGKLICSTKADKTLMLLGSHSRSEPITYYSSLAPAQKIVIVPSFTLDSGLTIHKVPIAYSTWGTLNVSRNNVLVICHALTGSSDAMDWWRPLIGPGKALDPSRYWMFCANVLGSPYGSASPLSTSPETGEYYGPHFPESTVRDDVRYVSVPNNMILSESSS